MSKVDKIKYTSKANVTLSSGKIIEVSEEHLLYDTKDYKLKFRILNNQLQNVLEKHYPKKTIKRILDEEPLSNITTYKDVVNSNSEYTNDLLLFSKKSYKSVVLENGQRGRKEFYIHTCLTPTSCGQSELFTKFLSETLNKEFLDKLSIYVTDFTKISVYLNSDELKRILKDDSTQPIAYPLSIDMLFNPITEEDIDKVINQVQTDNFYKYNFKIENKDVLRKDLKNLLTNIR